MKAAYTTRCCLVTVGAAALCTFTVPARVQAQAPQYTVTVLDNLSGGINSNGSGINASGQVAGYDGDGNVVRWTGTTPTDLGTLGGSNNYGFGINVSGQMAGYGYLTGDSVHHAIRWTGTTATDLGTLSGNYSFAAGINDSGQVAGYASLTGDTLTHAVRWTGTTPTDLGTLPGGTYSQGFGINNVGQVAGMSDISDGNQHAVRWTGTTPTDLGTLGGLSSLGYGINASGEVVGDSYTAGGADHAFLWNGTSMTDLGTLGGTQSEAYAINDSGEVTGESLITGSNSVFDAFLYAGGTMYDLNSLLVPGSGVTNLNLNHDGNSINDLGQIAASGEVGGQYYALLLTPSPELRERGAAGTAAAALESSATVKRICASSTLRLLATAR